MIRLAHKNSTTLSTIINDLLDMDKLVEGKMRFNLHVTNIIPIVEQAIENNKTYAVENNISLSLSKDVEKAAANVDSDRYLTLQSFHPRMIPSKLTLLYRMR